jgi:hypothetical protein
MTIVLWLILLLTPATKLLAQDSSPLVPQTQESKMTVIDTAICEISGQVVDEKKEPLIAATVLVYLNNELKGGNVTDFDGMYTIKPLPPGSYNLLVTYTGYDSLMVTSLIVGSGCTKQNLVLSRRRGFVSPCCVIRCVCPSIIDINDPTRHVWRRDYIENMPMR